MTVFRPPQITKAPDTIAFKLHGSDYKGLRADYFIARLILPITNVPAKNKQAILLSDPENYTREPSDYIRTEIALRLIFGNRKPFGLQLASNYGPYLFYQREARGRNFVGLDADRHAAAYAAKIGNIVVQGDAATLPFADKTFEVVISTNFLAVEYLSQLDLARGVSDPDLAERVTTEVYRVLKPGGWFFSELEIFSEGGVNQLFPPFQQPPQRFSRENWELAGMSNFCALRK